MALSPVWAEHPVSLPEIAHRLMEVAFEARQSICEGYDAGVRQKQRTPLVVRGHLHVEPYLCFPRSKSQEPGENRDFKSKMAVCLRPTGKIQKLTSWAGTSNSSPKGDTSVRQKRCPGYLHKKSTTLSSVNLLQSQVHPPVDRS